jgi:TPR repeat protein
MFKLPKAVIVSIILCINAAWAKEYTGEVIPHSQEIQAADAAYENKDFAIAIEKYKIVANKSNSWEKSDAMFVIGSIYYHGHIADENYKESLHWFKLAATVGNASAQFNLGYMHEKGQGVQIDKSEARRFYKLASDQGHADAQFNLGLMYKSGEGVVRDTAEALRLFKLAATQGSEEAQFKLAKIYYYGQAVVQDYAEAMRLFKLASAQGHAESQYFIGYMYSNGIYVKKNHTESLPWYKLAAAQGFASAQLSLGLMYKNGEGVIQDYAEALRWYKLSAAQGNPAALANLGIMYSNGEGVIKDNIRAHMLYNLASVQLPFMSESRDNLSKLMTSQQIAKAQSLAKECVASNYRNCGGELDPVLTIQNIASQSNPANKNTNLPTPKNRAPLISLQVTATEPDTAGAVYIKVQSNVSTASLKINDEEQGGDTAGKYSIKKFAMVGKPTTFTIVATDSNGNTDTKTVTVTRKAVDSVPVFIQLNPNNIKEHSKRDAVAIIIGIQDYKRLARAEYANTDAQVFYDYAVRALGIPAANIKLLVDADAEQLEVYKALRNWLPAKVNKGKTDVYVFYSGHGLPAEDGKSLYLLPYGADKDFLDKTAISQQEINNMLKAAQAKSITLFLDSCYSGQSRTGETLLASARPIALKAQSSSFPPEFTVITATAPDQMSWSSPELKHGIFSYYLMKGMEGDADLSKDGVITMQEMQNYLTENVARQAQRNGRTQLPQLQGDGTRVLVAK